MRPSCPTTTAAPFRRTACAALVVVSALLLASCSVGRAGGPGDPQDSGQAPIPTAVAPTPTPTPTPTSTPTPTPTPTPTTDAAALRRSWDTMAEDLSGEAGMVVMPVGGDADDQISFGKWKSGMAWSTIKVPIAVAADQNNPDSDSIDRLIHQAITVSSNEAAESLWVSLGSSNQARRATDKVLAENGDKKTHVGQNASMGRVTFGYTTWALTDQATFVAGLSCDDDAQSVVREMRKVGSEHRWGLGTLEGAAFKGGWGPYNGTYTSRQMGVVPVDGKGRGDSASIAVAMGIENPDGDGTEDLDTMADWLEDHLDELPAGTCDAG